MQQLDLLVKQYLELDTDYALLITGAWGTGKTHYFRNVLKPIIEDTDTIKDKSKRYKSITVSLFGLKTIGEIQTQILLSSFNKLNNGKYKTAGLFFSTFAKGLLNITGFNAETIDTSIWSEAINELKGFNNLVICFDDIERKNPDLHISQFVGFVNTLIEKHDAKVILIGNENKILDFSESKEKVIGNTVEYLPDYDLIFDSIVKEKFENENNKKYNDFLQSNKELIMRTFYSASKNLRTLKYALVQYERIYLEINELVEKENIFADKENDILKDSIHFTYSISEEYRTGSISYSEKKSLDSLDAFSMMLAKEMYDERNKVANEKSEEEAYLKSFSEKYYPSLINYNYFESIYVYITGGDIFRIGKLREEIIKIYHINKLGAVLPQYQVLEKLFWNNVYKLENKDYKTLTKQMVNYAYSGAYGQLNEYAIIFYYALRFNNPFDYSPNTHVRNLKKGIKKIYPKEVDLSIKYHPQEFINIKDNDIYKEQKTDLYQYILNLNQELETNSRKAEIRDLEDKCKLNLLDFAYQIKENYALNLLTGFNPRVFYSAFINASNEDKYYSYNILSSCFKEMSYYLHDISEFLFGLNKLFEKGKKYHVKKSLSGYYYNAMLVLTKNGLKNAQEDSKLSKDVEPESID